MIRLLAAALLALVLAAPAFAEVDADTPAPEATPEAAPATPAPVPPVPPVPRSRSVREWYEMGGAVMHGIAFCLALVLAVFAERMVALRRSVTVPRHLARSLLQQGLAEETLARCRPGGSSLARVAATLDRERRMGGAVAEGVMQAGAFESAAMSRHIPLLAAVGNIATMLGLLGTVFGMIEAFQQIAIVGTGDAKVVAGGIFRALVTTAAGLSVGIVALSAHAYLRRRVDALVLELEGIAGALLDEPAGHEAPTEEPTGAAMARA